ncbi:threonine-phosphate decarboxylase CobD [Albidovulum sediminicola]|uniref:threonine-phosphate decarboxylase n=1 Tax=Albidovulum sediminicola TaxID=2984331 RepID=A0ABT2YYN6_9RHOB|nr:threonine-phosphate decarboxylase CobD [Defluviimonas sp. WL0075]MCV2864000.1 threonine-phosphate decarboxylase CobD [Defluviimonas sp. WL0075]
MRDHGGNLDQAIAAYGGEATDWIDLSTGINRVPYPIPRLLPGAWTDLPTRRAMAGLSAAAARAYATPASVLPVAGAQAAIQMIPRLGPPGSARVLAPTYNEHAAALRSAGWQVEEVAQAEDLAGADLAVIVNPNNPDGRRIAPDAALALAGQVGRLVVDESFADISPELSVAARAGQAGLFVLRSFGKFYGLAGVRLGFLLGNPDEIAALAEMAGPWPISGAAIALGQAALADAPWAAATTARLAQEAASLDTMAATAGWRCAGGTTLFRLYDTGDAAAAQDRLAHARIWTRRFPYSEGWLRLGLPGTPAEWARLEEALKGMNAT